MEILLPYTKFAEDNNLSFKLYGSDCKFVDKGYLVKELNPPHVVNVVVPIFHEPTKWTVKKHLLYDDENDDDDEENEDVEFWIQTVRGKQYARWFNNGTNYHLAIWAKTTKQIDQFTDYLCTKHGQKDDLSGATIYEWTRFDGYRNTGKKCTIMTESNLVGLEDFFKSIETDLVTLEKHQDLLERLGTTNGFSYLLYGPPGTGKTSCIKALAHKYDRAIFCVDLNEVDSSHLKMALSPNMNGVKHPIILVEDFDRYLATGNGQKKVSQLLNALDGVSPGYCAIRFFSANMVEKFENAALASRMRRLLHFPAPSAKHIVTHLQNVFGSDDQQAFENMKVLAQRCDEKGLAIRTINHYITRFLMDEDPIKSAVEGLDNWFYEMDTMKKIEIVIDDGDSSDDDSEDDSDDSIF